MPAWLSSPVNAVAGIAHDVLGEAWFLLLGVVILFVLSWIDASRSGWRRLGARYGQPLQAANFPTFRTGGGRVGSGQAMPVKVAVDAKSLVMKRIWPWRFGHPTLWIPWSDVATLELRDSALDDDASGFERWIARRSSGDTFARIRLTRFSHEVLNIPWDPHWRVPLNVVVRPTDAPAPRHGRGS